MLNESPTRRQWKGSLGTQGVHIMMLPWHCPNMHSASGFPKEHHEHVECDGGADIDEKSHLSGSLPTASLSISQAWLVLLFVTDSPSMLVSTILDFTPLSSARLPGATDFTES